MTEGDEDGAAPAQQSRVEGEQRVLVEPGEYQLKAQSAAQRHELALKKQAHDLTEARQENQQRRLIEGTLFFGSVGIVVAALVAGFIVAIWSNNADTRRFGQGLVGLLLTFVAGALGGYLTGKRSK